jgi:stearoyl-CoA desaturase (delta-9 desaturase)
MQRTRPLRQQAPTAAVIALAHVPPLTLFWTGAHARDWIAFGCGYVLTIFALGIVHRFFAHRAFRTTRPFQFLLGLLGGMVFADAVAFAGKHRLHHKYADTPQDVHSPRQGFWFCWIGSLLDEGYTEDQVLRHAADLTRYPELRWLHRWFFLPAVATGIAVYLFGGYTMFAAGFCLNVVVAVHAPSAVNYFCHRGGSRRFATADDSTNRPILGLLLLGEGWHHNHHYYPAAARSGFRWYEVDVIYYVLRLWAAIGLIWDVRDVPASVKAA